MVHGENIRILKMALTLKLIDPGQFNELTELSNKEPDKDSRSLLVDGGYITNEQYQKILTMIAGGKEVQLGTPSKDEVLYSGNFIVRGILGQGGVGCVFLGYDKNIGREVAIKEIVSDESDPHYDVNYARFVREAKITGQLEHPGVVPVYEMNVKEDGTVYYVMKHVKGKTLFHAINECAAGMPEEAFRKRMLLFDQLINVCEAMGYAHSKGIIHRDLKPGNIVLGKFGETIILDWGTAKKIGKEEITGVPQGRKLKTEKEVDAELTRQGELLGTPSYMAPEQIDPRFGEVDPSTDVYALGVMLFILLTGEKPYKGKAKEVMAIAATDAPSPSPRSRCDFIPPELDAICRKAMSKGQRYRFQNASEMLSELKAYRDGRLVSIYAYSRRELFRRFVSRNKLVISAVSAVVISIIAGAGFAVNFGIEAQRARAAAESAFVDVTKLIESTMPLARNAVKDMSSYFGNIAEKMNETAATLKFANLTRRNNLFPFLKELQGRFPEVEEFMVVIPPGKIVASSTGSGEVPLDIKPERYNEMIKAFSGEKIVMSDIFTTPNGQHAFAMQVPIYRDSRIGGILRAVLLSYKVIPRALPFDPLKSDYQVWVMQQDGFIIYDEDVKQIGKYLFTDKMYAKFPELLTFGEQMRKDPWGIGHYKFKSKRVRGIVYKIAAWDTVKPLDKITWKIVVTYPYKTK